MKRVLNRPMFRIGGSAGTGITSGLDQPRKQYENGLPEDGDISLLPTTLWGTVVPQNQSLFMPFLLRVKPEIIKMLV